MEERKFCLKSKAELDEIRENRASKKDSDNLKIVTNTKEDINFYFAFEDVEYQVECYLDDDDSDIYSVHVYDNIHAEVNPYNDNEVMYGLFDSDGGTFDDMKFEVDDETGHYSRLEDKVLELLFGSNGLVSKHYIKISENTRTEFYHLDKDGHLNTPKETEIAMNNETPDWKVVKGKTGNGYSLEYQKGILKNLRDGKTKGWFRTKEDAEKAADKLNNTKDDSYNKTMTANEALEISKKYLGEISKDNENVFYFDDKTEEIVANKPNNSHTVIKTSKTLKQFINDFDKARDEGNSIIDSIEIASSELFNEISDKTVAKVTRRRKLDAEKTFNDADRRNPKTILNARDKADKLNKHNELKTKTIYNYQTYTKFETDSEEFKQLSDFAKKLKDESGLDFKVDTIEKDGNTITTITAKNNKANYNINPKDQETILLGKPDEADKMIKRISTAARIKLQESLTTLAKVGK